MIKTSKLSLQVESPRWSQNWLRGAVLSIWATFCVYGLYFASKYSMTPGVSSSWTSEWDSKSPIPFKKGKFNLIVFFHPECDCSKATLNQLEEIIRDAGVSNNHYTAVFYIPTKMQSLWRGADLLERVKKNSKIDLYIDEGAEFKRFDVKTSGQTFLFGPSMKLLFSGGLTIARGHIGANFSQSLVTRMLTNNDLQPIPKTEKQIKSTPIFGCHTTEEKTL